jgi:XTP/dITP diphosphohydrolase
VKVQNVDQVWANWEQIKRAEKQGTKRERPSALDGIPAHLPALLRAEKLVKKARKAGLLKTNESPSRTASKAELARQLFALAAVAQQRGWSAEELLRSETRKRERAWRQAEAKAKS